MEDSVSKRLRNKCEWRTEGELNAINARRSKTPES